MAATTRSTATTRPPPPRSTSTSQYTYTPRTSSTRHDYHKKNSKHPRQSKQQLLASRDSHNRENVETVVSPLVLESQTRTKKRRKRTTTTTTLSTAICFLYGWQCCGCKWCDACCQNMNSNKGHPNGHTIPKEKAHQKPQLLQHPNENSCSSSCLEVRCDRLWLNPRGVLLLERRNSISHFARVDLYPEFEVLT
jgi:hypothetical protein